MKLTKLIYLLLFLIIVTIPLSSCARRTRINPYGLLDVLEEHEILNLRRTRVEHVVLPNAVRFNFYLRNIDFTKADLMAIRDTMSLYLQSDEFIAFAYSKNHIGFYYDSWLETSIRIQTTDGNMGVVFSVNGIENFNDGWSAIFYGLQPDGLLEALAVHEILNLNRTRVEHWNAWGSPNSFRFVFWLRNVDFTRDDLMAIRDTMSLYLQSDEFISFVESNNNIGFFYDSSLEIEIRIFADDRRRTSGRNIAWFSNRGITNFNDTWIDRFFGFSD